MDTAGLICAFALAFASLAAAAPLQPAQDNGAPASTVAQPAATAPGGAGEPAPTESTPATPVMAPAVSTPDSVPAARCDASSWRWLRGRSLNDLLSQRLPEGSRIVRVGDAPLPAEATRGRLVVEIGRNTRVRRVFCG